MIDVFVLRRNTSQSTHPSDQSRWLYKHPEPINFSCFNSHNQMKSQVPILLLVLLPAILSAEQSERDKLFDQGDSEHHVSDQRLLLVSMRSTFHIQGAKAQAPIVTNNQLRIRRYTTWGDVGAALNPFTTIRENHARHPSKINSNQFQNVNSFFQLISETET